MQGNAVGINKDYEAVVTLSLKREHSHDEKTTILSPGG